MSHRPEIIIVDDDPSVRRSLQMLLRGHGYRTRAYRDRASVAHDPEARSAALLIADGCLGGGNGFDVLYDLRARGWRGHAVLMTGAATRELAADALAGGFTAVLDKPPRPNIILNAARAATAHT